MASVPEIAVSASTGEGIQQLQQTILEVLGVYEVNSSSRYSVRERHLKILEGSLDDVAMASLNFRRTAASELLAEDLRHTHKKLGSLTGVVGSEEILGEIFSSFCIGK